MSCCVCWHDEFLGARHSNVWCCSGSSCYIDCSMFCVSLGLASFHARSCSCSMLPPCSCGLFMSCCLTSFFHARRRGCIGSAAFSSCSCSLLMIDPSHGRSIGRMDDRTIELCDRSIDRADERSVHRADGSTIDRADRRLSGQIGDQVDMLAEAKVPDPAPPHPIPPHG